MSEDKKVIHVTPDITKVNEPAGLTNADIVQMLLNTQKQLADALKEQSKAILESRKPYVDPAVIEQKKRDLEDRQRQVEMELKDRQLKKARCPHKRTNSDGSFNEHYNIKWMEHSNGIILGVCGTCFSQFDARIPEDLKFLTADGGAAYRNMGRARENTRRM